MGEAQGAEVVASPPLTYISSYPQGYPQVGTKLWKNPTLGLNFGRYAGICTLYKFLS